MRAAIADPSRQFGDVTWGNESLWLRLPGFDVCFSGLSVTQKEQLSADYLAFELSTQQLAQALAKTANPTSLMCEVQRLNSPLNIANENLERDGQYSPLKLRVDDGIEITGVNFKAYFGLNKQGIHQATISVEQENEFSRATVVENFLRIYAAHNALAHQGALLHSAGLVFDQKAYIFVGRSGVGKTTLTRKAHRAGATVLSDDINLVMPSESGFNAYKVPFTGEFGRTVDHSNVATSFPIKAIILLEQGDSISASISSAPNAVSRLIAGSPFVNTDELEIDSLFDIYTKLVSQLPIIKLAIPYQSEISDIVQAIDGVID